MPKASLGMKVPSFNLMVLLRMDIALEVGVRLVIQFSRLESGLFLCPACVAMGFIGVESFPLIVQS